MRTGWIKRFTDGSSLLGEEGNPNTSWSRSRLSDMASLSLYVDNQTFCIEGTGEYHQSDDYVMFLSDSVPHIISRRIQYKLETGKWLTITVFTEDGNFMVSLEDGKI